MLPEINVLKRMGRRGRRSGGAQALEGGLKPYLCVILLDEAAIHNTISPAVPVGAGDLFQVAGQALNAVHVAAQNIPFIKGMKIRHGFNGLENLHG